MVGLFIPTRGGMKQYRYQFQTGLVLQGARLHTEEMHTKPRQIVSQCLVCWPGESTRVSVWEQLPLLWWNGAK